MSHQTLSSYPQVIVAGMPRTGTESIKQALKILYGNDARAYHMTEVLNRPKHLEIWSDLAFGHRQVDQLTQLISEVLYQLAFSMSHFIPPSPPY